MTAICGRQFTPPFTAARYARIQTAANILLPCLVLTAAVDSLTAQVANDVLAGEFAERWHSAPSPGQYSASWLTFLGNMVFIQTVFVPVFGTNGPLWSLANEFWYYILFPLTWASYIAISKKRMLQSSVNLGLFFTIFLILPSDIKWGYLVWILGAVVSWLNHSVSKSKLPTVARILSIATLALGIVFSKWSSTRDWTLPWGDVILGLTVAVFLLTTLRTCAKAPRLESIVSNLVRHLSSISFSLYLSHFPVVMLIAAVFFHSESMQPALGAWLLYLTILMGLLVFATALWWLFERNTAAVKRSVKKVFELNQFPVPPDI